MSLTFGGATERQWTTQPFWGLFLCSNLRSKVQGLTFTVFFTAGKLTWKGIKVPILCITSTLMQFYDSRLPVLRSKCPLASILLQAIKTCRQARPPGYLMHFS